MCGKITTLFSLVWIVRSIVCSTYLYRDVDISAAGQLAWHHNYRGMLRYHRRDCLSTSVTAVEYTYPQCVHLAEMVRTWSRPPDRSSSTLSLLFYLFSSFETNLLFDHGHIVSAFPNNLFSFAPRVISTDTSMPPLQLSSQRQEHRYRNRTHTYFQPSVAALGFKLQVDKINWLLTINT